MKGVIQGRMAHFENWTDAELEVEAAAPPTGQAAPVAVYKTTTTFVRELFGGTSVSWRYSRHETGFD